MIFHHNSSPEFKGVPFSNQTHPNMHGFMPYLLKKNVDEGLTLVLVFSKIPFLFSAKSTIHGSFSSKWKDLQKPKGNWMRFGHMIVLGLEREDWGSLVPTQNSPLIFNKIAWFLACWIQNNEAYKNPQIIGTNSIKRSVLGFHSNWASYSNVLQFFP